MQTIILAGGLGGISSGDECPRGLIEIAGRPLVHYALTFARAVGADHRIVVADAGHDEVARRLESRDPDAVVVESSEPAAGALVSFLAGRARLEPGGFLLMDVGRIYAPAIADLVADRAAAAEEVTIFCDRRIDSESVMVRGAARLAGIGEPVARDLTYAGMTYVPAARVATHGDVARRLLDRMGESAPVESVLTELVADGWSLAVADLGAHDWFAVDRPAGRHAAEAALFGKKWWA